MKAETIVELLKPHVGGKGSAWLQYRHVDHVMICGPRKSLAEIVAETYGADQVVRVRAGDDGTWQAVDPAEVVGVIWLPEGDGQADKQTGQFL